MCGIIGHEATIKNVGSRDRRKPDFPETGKDRTMRSLICSNQQGGHWQLHSPESKHSSGAQAQVPLDILGTVRFWAAIGDTGRKGWYWGECPYLGRSEEGTGLQDLLRCTIPWIWNVSECTTMPSSSESIYDVLYK